MKPEWQCYYFICPTAELGDHDDIELDDGFTNDIDLMPKMATSQEDKIMQCYRDMR